MQASERRRKILNILNGKGILSYKEIFEEISKYGNILTILIDLDTLVSFNFLQHVTPRRKSEVKLETQLKLRPKTKKQLKNDPSRISDRLSKLEDDTPSWYRKLAILNVLNNREMSHEEVVQVLNEQDSHLNWHSTLVDTSLRILEKKKYVSKKRKKDSKHYTLTSKGKTLLEKDSFEQFLDLRSLDDEYNIYFRAHEIWSLVEEYNEHGGITSTAIIKYLQEEYGERGNQKRAVSVALGKMTMTGLLKVTGGIANRGGSVYWLGSTPKFLPSATKVNSMKDHNIQTFKETVEQFFRKYKVPHIKKDVESHIEQILSDFEQCNQNVSLISRDEWINHIIFLSNYLEDRKGKSWERQVFSCIVACILSWLLPSDISVHILEDHPPPLPSKKQYPHQVGIAREYYFNLTEIYLTRGNHKEAFHSFDQLGSLCWKSFDFLLLKARISALKCDMCQPGEFKEVIKLFKDAKNISKGEETIRVLFHEGLAYYQRGYFKEARKTWREALKRELSPNQEIVLNHNLAHVYQLSGYPKEAINLHKKNIEMARVLKMEESKIISVIGLTDNLIDLCLWEKAEKKLKEAIKMCKEKEFFLAEALAQANLGVISTRKGEHEKALSHLEKAVSLVNKMGNSYEHGSILIHLGDTFKQLKMIDEAMETFDMALKVIWRSDFVLMLTVEIKKADLYNDMGNFDKSLELSHSILQERWLGYRRSEAEAHRVQGRAHLLKKDFDRAKEHLERSEKIFRKLKLHYELLEVLKLLEVYYRNRNNEKQCYYRIERENLKQRIGLP